MKDLRTKLFLGFGSLITILAVVSVLSIVVITWYTGAIERVLRENYDSVVFGQKMIDALDDLTDSAQAYVFDGHPLNDQMAARQTEARKLFEKNLDAEKGNLTLEGELAAEEDLRAKWQTYRQKFAAIMASELSAAERQNSYRELMPHRDSVKAGAQKIIDMNLANMVSVNGQAKTWASHSRTALYALLVAGVGMAMILVIIVSRAILAPLKHLTASVKEIEQGNLNLVVAVRSRDEVGQLAEAFNAMTARLREFRRTDQAKLLRTQQTTQLAIDSLPDAVAVINPAGEIELANKTAQRLFHLTPETPVPETKLDWLDALYQQVLVTQKPQEPKGYQSALQVFDNGTERFFLPHALPILDKSNDLAGITIVLVDVTRLRQLDELKSSLVSTVSHELKTPLTAIRMANHLLLSERIGPVTPKQAEVLVEERDNANRLQSIIDNLLDMSRIESGKTELHLRPMAPHEIAMEATDPLRATMQDNGLTLQVDVPVDLPTVNADDTRIHHLLTNLLTNAIRYTPAGGEISVTADADDETVTFRVSDTGTGIPKAYIGRVFEKFFRVPGQSGQGAGLGLAIAKEIIQSHGGTISVESREGKGTTFTFTLPRATVRGEREITI